MSKLADNRQTDNGRGLESLLANLGSLSPHLDFEIHEDKVFIFATPDKGHSDEEESLEAMESVVQLLNEQGLSSEHLTRNTPTGDRIDGVRILVSPLSTLTSP